jgi:phosphatidylserine/phosphatidylglycerophosphate/cardiolipin synthase-like enzyme
MTRAVFTSLHGGAALPASVLDLIGRARDCAVAGVRVEIEVMCFAFTDARIAAALIALCRDLPFVTLRILADWSQSARNSRTVLEDMGATGLRNLFIKFKLDVPYRRDEAGRLRYSYDASLGMLHHKTLLIRLDGVPALQALGSYNWTARGQQAYENLIVSDDPAILGPFAAEFAALWVDHRLTGTADRARHIMARLKAEARLDRNLRDPLLLSDVLGLASENQVPSPSPRRPDQGAVIVAFSGNCPPGNDACAGHAAVNDRRVIDLLRPAGTRRPAPLTLNTLALEAIRAVPSSARLLVAMYALSPRVPEFGALIDAARRGVEVAFILDGTIGRRAAGVLSGFALREGLSLKVQITRRRMHQKYLCCPETGMVLTGTANMTEDATARHSDHRILWRNDADLAAAFSADFDTVSARLAPAQVAA